MLLLLYNIFIIVSRQLTQKVIITLIYKKLGRMKIMKYNHLSLDDRRKIQEGIKKDMVPLQPYPLQIRFFL